MRIIFLIGEPLYFNVFNMNLSLEKGGKEYECLRKAVSTFPFYECIFMVE